MYPKKGITTPMLKVVEPTCKERPDPSIFEVQVPHVVSNLLAKVLRSSPYTNIGDVSVTTVSNLGHSP
jgi:hypothetical protein